MGWKRAEKSSFCQLHLTEVVPACTIDGSCPKRERERERERESRGGSRAYAGVPDETAGVWPPKAWPPGQSSPRVGPSAWGGDVAARGTVAGARGRRAATGHRGTTSWIYGRSGKRERKKTRRREEIWKKKKKKKESAL